MAKFSFDKFYRSKGKAPVTQVSVPDLGENGPPARFRLDGLCDPTGAGIAKLAKAQVEDIRVHRAAVKTAGGAVIRQSNVFDGTDLADAILEYERSATEKPTPADKPVETPKMAAQTAS